MRSQVRSAEPRLSVSGWFHAAEPPDGAATNASLAQLQSRGGAASRVAASGLRLRPLPRPPRGAQGGVGRQRLGAGRAEELRNCPLVLLGRLLAYHGYFHD